MIACWLCSTAICSGSVVYVSSRVLLCGGVFASAGPIFVVLFFVSLYKTNLNYNRLK